MRTVSSQGGYRAEVYAGYGTYGIPAYGYRTRSNSMGTPEDITAGKRNPRTSTEGGENVELWQLMNPAAGRVRGNRVTLFGRFRLWKRRRRSYDLEFLRGM